MTSITDYSGAYLDWLAEIMNCDMFEYSNLFTELHNIDFKFVIDMDSNRTYDGMVLRMEFPTDTFDSIKYANKPCSVLEALIGLSRRMDWIASNDEDVGVVDHSRVWFWTMIDNLGLTRFTNDNMGLDANTYIKSIKEIRTLIDNWLSHIYSPDGTGSPWPCPGIDADMRYFDMIDCMNTYVMYNDLI